MTERAAEGDQRTGKVHRRRMYQPKGHQPVKKAWRETEYEEGEVHRDRCLTCTRTSRVYPKGVRQAQHTSDRVKGLAMMLSSARIFLWGRLPRHGTFEHAALENGGGRDRARRFQTSSKGAGPWLHLGRSMDAMSGLVITSDDGMKKRRRHSKRELSREFRAQERGFWSPTMLMGCNITDGKAL